MSKLSVLLDSLERQMETNLNWARAQVAAASDPADTDNYDAAGTAAAAVAGKLTASQAAHVDPSTGSAGDVINALIAAGLMAG
jgi:hypothetical protein